MRLRLAFKLHGDEAELARQIADAANIEVDKIAKLAMQRYMQHVIDRAQELADQVKGQQDANRQPSNPNPDDATGIVPPPSDALPG